MWYEILCSYFVAIRSLDPDGWGLRNRPVYQARVLRAFLRLLPTLVAEIGLEHSKVPQPFAGYLDRVDMELLSLEKSGPRRGAQASKQFTTRSTTRFSADRAAMNLFDLRELNITANPTAACSGMLQRA